jgi:hypothetical protein
MMTHSAYAPAMNAPLAQPTNAYVKNAVANQTLITLTHFVKIGGDDE